MSRTQLTPRVPDLQAATTFHSRLFGTGPAKLRRDGYANSSTTEPALKLALVEGTAGEGTACGYALQDKAWVRGPGQEPSEVYVVKADADTLAKQPRSTCCTPATASLPELQPDTASC
ncbi:glyoxalase/bleomycin resistance/dioxygenase family protein [Streptomyces sp. AC512_CC834]|uniref:glyoxalase/bleomycin resistance/dioxygenase family protein n=1 Tax=Streptomyces sp. AC512_CC834 TaxID=2823691 RepID=UPI001C252F37|nr:glyoxalase/bleomycin resistance/dioxygenase family protein [Streptomyces sp. AC512_CC834]